VWYRDSQLFESYQINEFTTELTKKENDDDIKSNFIQWTGEKEVTIKITIIVPKKVICWRKKNLRKKFWYLKFLHKKFCHQKFWCKKIWHIKFWRQK